MSAGLKTRTSTHHIHKTKIAQLETVSAFMPTSVQLTRTHLSSL